MRMNLVSMVFRGVAIRGFGDSFSKLVAMGRLRDVFVSRSTIFCVLWDVCN